MRRTHKIKFCVSLVAMLMVVSLPVYGSDLEEAIKEYRIQKEQSELRVLLEKERELQELLAIEELRSREMMAEVDEMLYALNDDKDLVNNFEKGKKKFRNNKDRQRKHLDQLRLLKLLEVLDLREDQEMEFLSAFNTARKEQRGIERELRQAVSELSEILENTQVSEDEIIPKIEKIIETEKAKTELRQSFLERIHEFLTPVQLGRFVIFQESFEADLLRQVRGFQGRHGRPGGPGR